MGIRSLENVGIVVDDLEAAIAFFEDAGLALEGRTVVEGDWVDRTVGLDDVRCEIAIVATAEGGGKLELMRFERPEARPGDRDAPPNTHGIRRLAFHVDDIDAAVARLRERGHELLGEVVRYGDVYRICYVRGPEGIILMLGEPLG